MKMEIVFKGDFFEDNESFQTILHAFDMSSAIRQAQNYIRKRLKHGESVSEYEESTLEELREILHVEGIE